MPEAVGGSQNPVTRFFENFRLPTTNQSQNPRNGPSNQQPKTGEQNQNADPKTFKFDPMTGKPVGGGSTNNPETQTSPLDAYRDLWKKIEPGQEDMAPQFSIKPETINAAAEGLDFMGSVPDDIDLSVFGDNKETLGKLMNHIGRMAYATAINHQSQLTGKYTDLRLAHESKSIPKHIRESMTNFEVDNDPSASNSPVVKEALKMATSQFQRLHPDASPQQIAKMAKAYFMDLNKAMHPEAFQSKEEQDKGKNEAPGGIDFDWGKYAGVEKAA